MKNSGTPKITPLYDEHRKLNARLTEFEGWNLPVQYSGIIDEHLHTRSHCSVFDVSHMGEFIISGNSAVEDLQRLHTCDINKIKAGSCRYGFLLNPDGGVIDDTIIYNLNDTDYLLVVNAGCISKDKEWILLNISADTSFKDISEMTAKIDLQGPSSRVVIEKIFPNIDFYNLRRFSFIETEYEKNKILISATGYTGEKGYELFSAPETASVLWNNLLLNEEVLPAGLGARDSLRLEKGLSLYGHELDQQHTPYESNLERFITAEKDFIGRDSLIKQKEEGLKKILVPFLCENRRAARKDYEVYSYGRRAGIVTSGLYSPVLKKGIGMCFIDYECAIPGNVIKCRMDNIEINAVIVDLPFVK